MLRFLKFKMRKTSKKGQLEIGFNWIYVLIAGTVILMFFVGIVIRQATVSEEKLSGTVLREIEGIFTGASLSQETVYPIDLPRVNLEFTCDELTGYSDYSIKGGTRAETSWQPIFAPEELETQRLLTWTLGWDFPFPVINYLFISSPDVKYYISDISRVSLPSLFNFEAFDADNLLLYRTIKHRNEEQIRFVFVDVDGLPDDGEIPDDLKTMADEKLTAVLIRANGAQFFKKDGDHFESLGTVSIINYPPVNNPNLYAAVFSTDPGMYKCNLRKALVRLEILARIYGERIERLQEEASQAGNEACGILIGDEFEKLETAARECQDNIEGCGGMGKLAEPIEDQNEMSKIHLSCMFLIY